MTKAVISGYYGYKNFGDELILSILINHLKELGIEITVLSGDIEYTKKNNSVNSINRFNIRQIIKEIKNSDILISGGGSLLQDVTSFKSLAYYSFIIALGILYNKKVIIFAQGIGPINSNFAKTIVKNLLNNCNYISVRDENSLKLLENWNIKSELVCDPAYSLNIKTNNETNGVGIQLRDFSTMNYNLLQKIAMLCISKFSDKKIKIFSLQKSKDYEICKKFQNIIKNINPNIKTEIVETHIIDEISKLEYMIGMRFHALLCAIKFGVKTCAINYDIKVEQLATQAKIPVISMDAKENFEEIYEKLENQNTENLINFTKSKIFDWTNFDKIINK